MKLEIFLFGLLDFGIALLLLLFSALAILQTYMRFNRFTQEQETTIYERLQARSNSIATKVLVQSGLVNQFRLENDVFLIIMLALVVTLPALLIFAGILYMMGRAAFIEYSFASGLYLLLSLYLIVDFLRFMYAVRKVAQEIKAETKV